MFRAASEPQSKRHVRNSFFVVGEGILSDPGTDEPAEAQAASSVAALRKFQFSRLGPKAKPEQLLNRAQRTELAQKMTTDPPGPGGQPNSSPGVPAGFTYLGQFVDHDLTLDATAVRLEEDVTVQQLLQGRSPALDLDSLYGLGPDNRFDRRFYEDDGIRIKSGTTQGIPGATDITKDPLAGFDLPRVGAGSLPSERRRPLIPDPRNDENLVVAQIHSAFIRFHNRFVTELADKGVSSAVLFESAREAVVKHYQWMLVHDFLPRIVEGSVIDEVFSKGRKHFEPSPGDQDRPTMPIEFSVAAYRLGHSMVRDEYEWNRIFRTGGLTVATLELLFRFTGTSGNLSPGGDINDPESGSFERLPTNWIADFRRLFDFPKGGRADLAVTAGEFNLTKRIDTLLVDPLAKLPLGSFGARPQGPSDAIELNLAFRNLTRANMVSLATGQQMASRLKVKPLLASDFDNRDGAQLSDALKKKLVKDCPLWFYILREAEVNGGGKLTGVGGRIVAEVFHRAIEGSHHSIVRDPFWRPFLTPDAQRKADGKFDMTDLLLYAFEGKAELLNPLGS